jgi:hypothetical protein
MSEGRISVPDPSNLLIAGAVASFDMVSGIHVCYRWLINDPVDRRNLEDVFKITLSNVHRQREQAYSECAISTIEIQSLSWFLVNSIFVIPRKPRSIYYSVGLVFDTRKTPETPHFAEILIYWCRLLALSAKRLLLSNLPLHPLASIIETAASELCVVAQNSIPRRPHFDVAPSDQRQYFLFLTAHFQTQMTTVVECGASRASEEDALRIGSFLAQFLLPFQCELSTLSILPKPSRHLFLQIVEKQKIDSLDHMLTFGRPVTWIQLSDRRDEPAKVIKPVGSPEEQRILYNQYLEITIIDKLAGDESVPTKLTELRQRFRVDAVVTPAPWAIGTVSLILWVPKNARRAICEQQLGAMLRCAISIVAIAHEKSTAGQLTQGEQNEREIQRALRLTGTADWEMAVGVAQLYDRGIRSIFDVTNKKMIARALASY